MTDIKRDVDFTVNVGDRRITQAGFGVEAVLAAHIKSKERVLSFANQTEVLSLFDATDPVALAASAAFTQKGEAGRLETFKVLRQLVDKVVLTLPTAKVTDRGDVMTVTLSQAIEGYTYILDTLDGESPVDYTAAAGDSAADVVAQLVSKYNALAAPAATAADLGDGVFTLTSNTPDTAFSTAVWIQGGGLVTSPIVANDFSIAGAYGVQFQEIEFHSTSISTSTATTIADGLASFIAATGAALSGEFSATGNGDGTLNLTIDTAKTQVMYVVEGTDFVVTLDTADATTTVLLGRGELFYHVPSADETVAETLAACADEDNDFYGVGSIYVQDADITALAAAIAPLAKVHAFITESADAADATKTTDPLSVTNSAAYDRSFGTYRKTKGTFFEFGQMGDGLPTDPGTRTWRDKTIIGQVTDNLTSAEEKAVLAKKGNVYTKIGGSGSTAEGTMASGRFIDTQRSIDFMEARTDEAFLALKKSVPKIPYTEAPGLFRATLNSLYDLGGLFNGQGITSALLDPTNQEFYRAFIPAPSDQTEADRKARNYPGIEVETQMTGAVHTIRGTINAAI